MPYHAGNLAGEDTRAIPADSILEPRWLADELAAARARYGQAPLRVLGTVWWYSVSSVLVAPALESFAGTTVALDPSLSALTLDMHPDGRFVGARSDRVLGRDRTRAGAALGATLEACVTALGTTLDAPLPALWAIAADSIGNRLLWAGNALGELDYCTELAEHIATAVGHRMPTPRYVDIGQNRVVRRASCCLVYEVSAGNKCTSCPRQSPTERERRIRALLG